MVHVAKAASAPLRRVLVVEDDYFLASTICQELEDLGVEVIGPVSSVASAIEHMASNDALEGAILDIDLGGEWVYPVAGALSQRHVPYVFWTGYGSLQVPEPHRAASVIQKPATGSQLVQALFDAVRRAHAADPAPLSDVYVTAAGEFLLMIRSGPGLEQDPALTWVGSTFLNRAGWSRTLRMPLRAGVFYRIPPRFLVNLKAQLTILG
jgi:CheY-like chemotaxis protein